MADNVGEPHCSSKDPSTSGEVKDEEAVSMLDVLEEERQLEEDANAVLGDSDDKNCTYLMGYVPRQALYACMTCIDPKTDLAGVCLACCLHCHNGHDLVELYTKRNFRCDCGNSLFRENKCKLFSDKASINKDNNYNQNFKGTYCNCQRPYPDPDDETEDEMIQCVVCEDWLHGRHLGTEVPDDFDEMVCAACMKKCDFLWAYTLHSSVNTKVEKTESDETVDIEQATPSTSKLSPAKSSPTKAQECGEAACQLRDLEERKIQKHSGSTFWHDHWRNKLCQCNKCMTMYENLRVQFILQESDSIKAYEERGKNKASNQYEDGMSALSGMDRIQQVEMLHGYNDMKSELTDYLKKFAENKKVVREEDIREFFQTLAANKRKKTSSAPQHFCK